MPKLDAYYQAHQDDSFVMLAVNAGENSEKVRDYIADGGYTFPVMLDKDSSAVADYFGGLRGMPTSFILNGNGEIVYEHIGVIDSNLLETQVAPLLVPISRGM